MMLPKGAPGEGHGVGGGRTTNQGHATGWSDRSVVGFVIHVVDEAKGTRQGERI